MNKEKIRKHWELCEQMNATYEAKNSDYGDSFTKVRQKYRNAILIRLNDKVNRLESLYDNEQKVLDESIEDTLIDLANYAMMEVIEMRMEKE